MNFSMMIMNFVSSTTNWVHSHVKKTPVAGPTYTYLIDYVGSPLWNVACKAKDVATPHFREAYNFIEAKACKRPVIAVGIGIIFTAFTLRALVTKYKNTMSKNT